METPHLHRLFRRVQSRRALEVIDIYTLFVKAILKYLQIAAETIAGETTIDNSEKIGY
jgi:hypothetical protein